MEKRYGYIRVSSRDQNPDRQYLALENAEVNRKNIFIDKISGHDFSRPSYRKMIRKLKKGDVLVVKSIDRLGRNYGEILEQWRYLTKEIGVDIEVLDMPLLNTDLHRENLIGVFISDLVLQILAYVAETERDFIRQRQAEGIAIAKANGIRFGRRKNELPEEFNLYFEMWKKNMTPTIIRLKIRCMMKKEMFWNIVFMKKLKMVNFLIIQYMMHKEMLKNMGNMKR